MLNYNKKFKNKGKRVPKSFYYSSLNNSDLLKIIKLKQNLKLFKKMKNLVISNDIDLWSKDEENILLEIGASWVREI